MSENYESFGYALAMSVLQSDLYAGLDDRERAECDELIARGQGKRRPSQGEQTAGGWVSVNDRLPELGAKCELIGTYHYTWQITHWRAAAPAEGER